MRKSTDPGRLFVGWLFHLRTQVTVCAQSIHGSTSQPQWAISPAGPVTTLALSLGTTLAAFAAAAPVVPLPTTAASSVAASMSGIQRMNGVRSWGSTTYQILRAESHRAPSALAASFSANGVVRLMRMRGLVDGLDERLPRIPPQPGIEPSEC